MSQMFSPENYFGEYEAVIRQEIGDRLDSFKKSIGDLENRCTVRMMNVDYFRPDKGQPITVEGMLKYEKGVRGKVLSAFIYNDALWRLEAAHLMICVGMLNVAYANLRSCIEFMQTAFIVERRDEEAITFLGNREVNLKLLDELLINKEYSNHLKQLKELYTHLGVHRYLSSLQLSSLFGANRFEKFVAESLKKHKTPQLPRGFADAANMCIEHGERVWLMFGWLESIPVKESA